MEQQPTGLDVADAWRLLGYACYRTDDKLGEIHAFIERAQLASVPYQDISNTASRLNAMLREHELGVDEEEKGVLVFLHCVCSVCSMAGERKLAQMISPAWRG